MSLASCKESRNAVRNVDLSGLTGASEQAFPGSDWRLLDRIVQSSQETECAGPVIMNQAQQYDV